MKESTDTTESSAQSGIRRTVRIVGQLVVGFSVGLLLMPALFELGSLIGDISPFKYQGF